MFDPDVNPPHRGTIYPSLGLTLNQISDSVILKRSNLVILTMGYDLFFYKYYSALSNPGLPRTLPFFPSYNIIYD